MLSSFSLRTQYLWRLAALTVAGLGLIAVAGDGEAWGTFALVYVTAVVLLRRSYEARIGADHLPHSRAGTALIAAGVAGSVALLLVMLLG